MRACILEIRTESDGEVSFFRADASFTQTESGEKVVYPVEEDEGEITFSDRGLAMNRRGQSGLHAEFYEGRKTEMQLRSASLIGKIPVRTTHYLLQERENGREIELCYSFADSSSVKKFELRIEILFLSEET